MTAGQTPWPVYRWRSMPHSEYIRRTVSVMTAYERVGTKGQEKCINGKLVHNVTQWNTHET